MYRSTMVKITNKINEHLLICILISTNQEVPQDLWINFNPQGLNTCFNRLRKNFKHGYGFNKLNSPSQMEVSLNRKQNITLRVPNDSSNPHLANKDNCIRTHLVGIMGRGKPTTDFHNRHEGLRAWGWAFWQSKASIRLCVQRTGIKINRVVLIESMKVTPMLDRIGNERKDPNLQWI